MTHRLFESKNVESFSRLYRVNVFRSRSPDAGAPVVNLTNSTSANLIGKIDQNLSANNMAVHSDHSMVKIGALLEADGGFLTLEIQDLLANQVLGQRYCAP